MAKREGPGAKRETAGSKRRRGEEIVARLHELYPDAEIELDWETPLQLLVATQLAAQSTDARVNQVTPALFARYPTARDLAAADPETLREEIRSTGFYRQKAERVLGTARKLVADHGGEVPDTMEELLALPGVARKTANVVLGVAFRKPEGVIVDTHVTRLSGRLGLSAERDPVKIERDLMALLPRGEWTFTALALTLHGRRVCHARTPECSRCHLAPHCPRIGVARSA